MFKKCHNCCLEEQDAHLPGQCVNIRQHREIVDFIFSTFIPCCSLAYVQAHAHYNRCVSVFIPGYSEAGYVAKFGHLVVEFMAFRRRNVSPYFKLACLFLRPANSKPLPPNVEAIKCKANEKFGKQKYTLAINLYNKAIRMVSDSPVLYCNRAAAFMKRAWWALWWLFFVLKWHCNSLGHCNYKWKSWLYNLSVFLANIYGAEQILLGVEIRGISCLCAVNTWYRKTNDVAALIVQSNPLITMLKCQENSIAITDNCSELHKKKNNKAETRIKHFN